MQSKINKVHNIRSHNEQKSNVMGDTYRIKTSKLKLI